MKADPPHFDDALVESPFDPRDPSTFDALMTAREVSAAMRISKDALYRMLRLPPEEQPQPPLKIIQTGPNGRMMITRRSLLRLLEIEAVDQGA